MPQSMKVVPNLKDSLYPPSSPYVKLEEGKKIKKLSQTKNAWINGNFTNGA